MIENQSYSSFNNGVNMTILSPTQTFMRILTKCRYGRPAGHGVPTNRRAWESLFPFFEKSNREMIKGYNLQHLHVSDNIAKNSSIHTDNLKGSQFLYDCFIDPKNPCLLEIKEVNHEFKFNGNDSLIFSEGKVDTLLSVMQSMNIPSKDSLFAILDMKNGYYRATIINLSKIIIKSLCSDIVNPQMRVIEQGKKSLIGTERLFSYRYQVIGSSQGEYSHDLSLIFIDERDMDKKLYPRLRVKFSSLSIWSSKRHHNRAIKRSLVEGGYMTRTISFATVRNGNTFVAKQNKIQSIFNEIERIRR